MDIRMHMQFALRYATPRNSARRITSCSMTTSHYRYMRISSQNARTFFGGSVWALREKLSCTAAPRTPQSRFPQHAPTLRTDGVGPADSGDREPPTYDADAPRPDHDDPVDCGKNAGDGSVGEQSRHSTQRVDQRTYAAPAPAFTSAPSPQLPARSPPATPHLLDDPIARSGPSDCEHRLD